MEQEIKILSAKLLFDQGSSGASPAPTIYGTLQNVEGALSIWLTILVDSTEQPDLGKLYNGAKVKMLLDNGETLDFAIQHAKMVEEGDSFKFGLSLSLGINQIEALQSDTVKTIELPWSIGAKDYPLSANDFFVSQLPCLL